MAASRRTTILAVLLAITIVVGGAVWISGGSDPVTRSTTPRAGTPAQVREARGGSDEAPPEVQLEALNVRRAEPRDAVRNPFRFEPRRSVPAESGVAPRPDPTGPDAGMPTMPTVPAEPPPPPPIPLKFIGLIEQGGKRVAVLSDGRSTPSGTEGAIILGQYRILKIGAESIEMAYVDGRGRQTIRFTGQ